MESSVKIFPTPCILAEKFAEELSGMIKESGKRNKPFTLALSGGSTPELLFSLLGDKYSNSVPWEFLHLFWGDERCVPPDKSESNFGMAKQKFIDKIDIPASNIHRIKGENDPHNEANRYSNEISGFTEQRGGLPSFDLIILGLGEDGHTASIFPGHLDLFSSDKICEVATHPVTKQKRITLTGRVINNSGVVAFLVTGIRKSEIIAGIMKKSPLALNFPASYVVPVFGILKWFIDEEAANRL